MRSGKKSLEEGLRFLDALSNQLLNESEHPEKQQLDVFGIMVPRTACSADLTPAEVEKVKTHVTQHHAIQAAPILYAKAVIESLKRKYDRAEQVPAEKFETAVEPREPSFPDSAERCPNCKRDVTCWDRCVCGQWRRPGSPT